MKAFLQKLPLSKDSSFIFERYETPNFETPFHFHEEYEIVLCEKGFGKKIVGNHTSEYAENDLVFIGSNLPHWFRADDVFYEKQTQIKPASIVIQFKTDSFGESFFDLTEFKKLKILFEKSKNGISFYGETRTKINEIIKKNLFSSGATRFLKLIEILEIMANSKEMQVLSEMEMLGRSDKDSARMNIVFDQILKHFKEDISIEKIADMTQLSRAAFCRYFKSRTQKTFIEYLNEVRISHACKLLQESEMNISEICFDSGFNNLSNFNRLFRKSSKSAPKTIRKKY